MRLTQKKVIASILAIVAILLNSVSLSQVTQNSCDTIKIVAPAYLVLNDTTIHVSHDSTAIICNKYIVLTKNNGYSLYSKLIGESKKHTIVDKLLKLLIVSGTQDTMLLKKALINAEDAYAPYSGKIIRDIKIQVLKPFGATISDTSLPVISTWGEALNKSHISTSKKVIEHKLLFKTNDTVNPLELVENTKELSGLAYLQDAAIIVTNSSADSVNILVLVKDKFPWLPAVKIDDLNHMSAYLKHINILGLGQSFGAGLTYDTKSKPVVYLSDVNYYINNIYNQISGGINYHVSNDERTYQVLLKRELIPLSIRLGGGFEATQKEENIGIDPTNKNTETWFFKYRYYELWSSYLFYDNANSKESKDHTYLIPGIAFSKKEYLYRPYVSIDSNNRFSNNTNLLANIALVKQNYYRTNFIRYFGKAEYIPYGLQINLTGGYTWSEFINKPYIGIGLASTRNFEKTGYFFADFEFGTYFSGKAEQGAVNLSFSFLSNLHKTGRYRHRFLTSINYTDAINRYTNDMLYLGEDYGFIGIDEKAWYGNQRLFFELDAITYTPWYFLGFRFAMFSFGSVGLLGSDEYTIFHNSVLGSVGLGVYVSNDFLAINSFQVRVAYFPVTPDEISHFGISFSTINLIKQLNFLNTKPHIVEYK